MRGRPPAVPAVAIVDEVRLLIARHAGEPCPTLDWLSEQTGTNRRAVKNALSMLADAGELRVRKSGARAGIKLRRMAVRIDGRWRWTCWSTPRIRRDEAGRILPRSDKAPAPQPDRHAEAVMAAGRF